MRTQISLTADQHAGARRKAAELGVSMAEYIRGLVQQDLSKAGPAQDPSTIIGIGRSGGSDVATDKQQAVADAIVHHYDPRRA